MAFFAYFALGTLSGMLSLLLVGWMASAKIRRAEQEGREPTPTEALDHNALEVDRLTLGTRKNTRTMWGE